MNTGVFGGTFDPPHIGHLIAAQDAAEALRLDRLLFVPAAEPPHKRGKSITPAAIRLDMLQAAIQGDHRFEVCDLELKRAGPSYTVDTLRALNEAHAARQLYLLIGADQARELPTWREPEEIARLARIAVLSRDGIEHLPALVPLITHTVQVTRIDVSSTDIRQRAASGRPFRYHVPAAVGELIARHGLYGYVRPNGDAPPGVSG